ncbi:MAG TPA: glycosyl hydrolase family 8 [Candidatus Paceibacterota bacterium]|nr:glycosyl hydrolase family 8 [Candidatus Paceibacterota bacterium]
MTEQSHTQLSALVYGTCIVIVVLVAAFALNIGGILDMRPPEFSKRNMLAALWYQYKLNYLEPSSLRSLDKQRDNITTSEGQSYTLLRAAWMDDKDTFDSSWQWTKDNLQRKEDHLVSWLFGKRADGSYGVLRDQGGYNTASDADSDIALALIFASRRWNDQKYFGDGILIVRDIWNKEVVTIGGRPYLAANNVEKTTSKGTIVVNPSYLSPYAYKIFAEVDPVHDWRALASTSYEVIDQSMRLTLDSGASATIPPDWVVVDKATGAVSAAPASTGLSTNFSFDAMRLPWRLALDYAWTSDPRAKEALDKMGFLRSEWRAKGSLATSYRHDGARLTEDQALSMYGGAMGYFAVSDVADADAVYRRKLEAVYDTNESKWAKPQSYYDENWAWFGIALYAGELTNLYGDINYAAHSAK